jgi:hypothetical protein
MADLPSASHSLPPLESKIGSAKSRTGTFSSAPLPTSANNVQEQHASNGIATPQKNL